MSDLDRRTILDRIDRMLEIPDLIDAQGRILTGLRANRRTTEKRLKAREAMIRKEVLTDALYREQCRNKEERDAYVLCVQFEDVEWNKLERRLDQLAVAIDKNVNIKEVLDHERKALKAALECEYTIVLEEAMRDQALVEGTAKGLGAKA